MSVTDSAPDPSAIDSLLLRIKALEEVVFGVADDANHPDNPELLLSGHERDLGRRIAKCLSKTAAASSQIETMAEFKLLCENLSSFAGERRCPSMADCRLPLSADQDLRSTIHANPWERTNDATMQVNDKLNIIFEQEERIRRSGNLLHEVRQGEKFLSSEHYEGLAR